MLSGPCPRVCYWPVSLRARRRTVARLPAATGAADRRSTDYVQVEVEEQQPQAQAQEEKKGKGKASGKRFEIKKWNAVAM